MVTHIPHTEACMQYINLRHGRKQKPGRTPTDSCLSRTASAKECLPQPTSYTPLSSMAPCLCNPHAWGGCPHTNTHSGLSDPHMRIYHSSWHHACVSQSRSELCDLDLLFYHKTQR
ncbi:hypothetical protein FQA47_016833 [Oryzias melastigma]|uniref:Uncharacterized protein n=1 Tax=Oryzias melastigma TaxID=30732 RepID=A0A834CFX8_ORYME|nr:hypothetical protein FQA47_016833 [Oryzias melastigma]